MVKHVLSTILCLLIGHYLVAQELPNVPPSIQWQQINSAHFKIIYPKGLEKEAQRTTNILENLYGPASHSLGARPRKFPVLLQNQHAVSNGLVTIAPYHAEFYLFEPQNYRSQGNDRWLEHLAVHEYRHMVQFEKAITPFHKALYFLMGEYGPFLSAALATPQWFFEGDAVGTETAFGRSGRGRIPSFMMAFKANLMEKGGFNYYKQYLKSYRDLVPDHYVTGYLMTTYLKNKSGVDVWDRIEGRAFLKPFIPFTFSQAMKKESGAYLVPTYREMIAQQKQRYQEQLSRITPTEFQTIAHRSNKVFTNYYFPRRVFDNNVLAIKSGFSDIPAFVIIDPSGKEKRIFQLGAWQNPASLSANDSIVVWTELELDPRWQRRTYTVIKKLNLKTRAFTQLSKKSKYVSPAISDDGKKVTAIHQSENGLLEIHLLDASSGALLKVFDNPNNDRYAMPQFDRKGENLILLKNVDEGKAILLKNISTESEETLYFSNTENLGNPVIDNGWIYYATDFNGIDNIHAMNLDTQIRYQVTSSKYGAFHPRISSDNELFYNDYTADGFEMARIDLNPEVWKNTAVVEDVGFDFHEPMVENENFQEVLYNYPDSSYASTKYPKLLRSIRPYGWGLSALPVNNTYIVGVFSKDLLQTTSLSGFAIFNNSERVWRYQVSGSYQAQYPIIDGAFSYGARTVDVIDQNQQIRTYKWNESNITLGVRLPLNFSNSRYLQKVSGGANLQYIAVENYDVPVVELSHVRNGELLAASYKVNIQRMLRKSYLDLNTRWGQTLEINYMQTPFGGNYKSQLFSMESNLYFPGLFRHHSTHLAGSYQYDGKQNYRFVSPITYTRGFGYTSYDQFANLSLNYTLPLAYMDWHLGPIINLQRIYVNGFYDLGIGANAGMERQYLKSFGAEFSFNFNLFRLLPLIDMGVRYAYLPDFNEGVVQIIFGGVTF